jgi:transcriptional regulator with XRE-family HTH domain
MSTMAPEKLVRIIGQNVRRRRDELRMTQTTLAEKVGLPQSYISDLEGGKCAPRVATMAKLAEALEIPPSHLLDTQDVASI